MITPTTNIHTLVSDLFQEYGLFAAYFTFQIITFFAFTLFAEDRL